MKKSFLELLAVIVAFVALAVATIGAKDMDRPTGCVIQYEAYSQDTTEGLVANEVTEEPSVVCYTGNEVPLSTFWLVCVANFFVIMTLSYMVIEKEEEENKALPKAKETKKKQNETKPTELTELKKTTEVAEIKEETEYTEIEKAIKNADCILIDGSKSVEKCYKDFLEKCKGLNVVDVILFSRNAGSTKLAYIENMEAESGEVTNGFKALEYAYRCGYKNPVIYTDGLFHDDSNVAKRVKFKTITVIYPKGKHNVERLRKYCKQFKAIRL